MKKLLLLALCAFLFACDAGKKNNEETATTQPEKAPAQSEFADARYTETGKQLQAAFVKGDIDTWINSFADNAVYVWNSGDSLAGKQAIAEYWKKRWSEVLQSLQFNNNVWLPVKVNQSQSVESTGVWLLNWNETVATYQKTGKTMTQWMHTSIHFDSNDKIDRYVLYLDRVPITAAMTK
jgi:hypothetical protein